MRSPPLGSADRPHGKVPRHLHRSVRFYPSPVLGAGHDEVAEATAIFSCVLGSVRHSDWAAPTACPAWSVSQLLNHVVATLTKFSDFAEGRTDAPRTPSGDLLLPDAASAFAAARGRAVEAWTNVDPSRSCRLPFGDFSAARAAAIAAFDVLLHAWDLARAVDIPVPPPSERLIAVASSVAERLVTAEAIGHGFYARPEATREGAGWEDLLRRTGRQLPGPL